MSVRISRVLMVVGMVLGSRVAFCADVSLEPGERAPEITLKALLNAPDGAATSLDALRGKVVVLNFWATWCGPCVACIPSVNKIEAAHAQDPIVFIHVTDEDASVVRKFLKDRPIHGWVGIDDDGRTFERYGVRGRPEMAVIDKAGMFLGWGDPRILIVEPEILKDVLTKGSSNRLNRTQGDRPDPLEGISRDRVEGHGGRNLFDLVIRPSGAGSAERMSGRDGRGRWHFDAPVIDHIVSFCGVPAARVISATPIPDEHLDIIVRTTKTATPALDEATCRLIGAALDLSFTREKRRMDVYLLRVLPGREPTLSAPWGGVYFDEEADLYAPSQEILDRMKKGEQFFFTLSPLSMLADNISGAVNKPVVAELGDLPKRADKVYSFCFPHVRGDVDGLQKALEQHVGFTLVPAQREVEVLVVRSTTQPTSQTED